MKCAIAQNAAGAAAKVSVKKFLKRRRCAATIGVLFFRAHAVPGAVGMPQSRVTAQFSFVSYQEIPVERVKRASIGAGFLSHIVATSLTVV